MAARLEKESDRKERGWFLLARKKADEIEAAIEARRKEVATMLGRAEEAETKGRPDLARKLRLDLIERFGKYSDAAETLAPLRALDPPEGTARPGETADPAGPASPK